MITAALSSLHVGRANGRRITETGARGLRFPPGARLGFHVMLAGDGWLITRDAEPVALRPGDIIFTGADAEHGLARSPCRLADLPEVVMADLPPSPVPVDFEFLCATYPLDHGRVPAVLRHLPDVVAFTPDYGRHPQLRAVVEMLRLDYTEPGPGAAAHRGGLIDVMLVTILRHLTERHDAADRPATTDPGIADALRAMHDQPERQWTVPQLGGVAGMARTTFTRRFTTAMGIPPMAYLTDWRLRSGARLLRQSDAPVAAVARQVGYANAFAFGTAFRRKYGVPPGRYRQAAEPADPAEAETGLLEASSNG
jgi:AraC-like DNA-binding protein